MITNTIIHKQTNCHSVLGDCVVMLLCHYETPLRCRGNLMHMVTYEIASVVTLSRNDITTQYLDTESRIFITSFLFLQVNIIQAMIHKAPCTAPETGDSHNSLPHAVVQKCLFCFYVLHLSTN